MNVNSWLASHKNKDSKLILVETLQKSFPEEEISLPWLVTHEDFELPDDVIKQADFMFDERENGLPLAYILGCKEFYGRDFYIDNNVLIPRAETEQIIDILLDLRPKNILEIGTGSGCIAITTALEIPDSKVTATDISPKALGVAQKNAEILGAKVDFEESDLLLNIDGNFDTIVANLPYVDENWDWLDKKSLSFEPSLALYAKNNGLELIYKLLEQAKNRCRYIILESDPCQHSQIIEFAKNLRYSLFEKRGFILTFQR